MKKKLIDYQTNKAHALAIELAAINRYPRAYIMRTMVRLLVVLSPGAGWAIMKLWSTG